MSEDARQEARQSYEAGDYERSRQVSLTGLEIDADDLELLRLAGKSGVEVAAADAVTMLQRVVALEPGDARAWHDLGEAFAAEGRTREAADAFARAVELQPDDPSALVDFGHSAYAAGRTTAALDALERAVELDPSDTATLRNLIGMLRGAGRLEDALGAAQRVAEADPEDALALVEIADLELALGRPDEALAAYARLREADDEGEHEVYAVHGAIQVEMRRGNWARAHELAQEAIALDASARTESLLGFFAAQAAAPSDHPGRAEAEAALTASQAEHRRLHSNEFAAF